MPVWLSLAQAYRHNMSDFILLQTKKVCGRLKVSNEEPGLHLVQFGLQGGQLVQDL